MSTNTIDSVDFFLQGEKEPSGSWVFIVLGLVLSLSFLVLYSILYPFKTYQLFLIYARIQRRI